MNEKQSPTDLETSTPTDPNTDDHQQEHVVVEMTPTAVAVPIADSTLPNTISIAVTTGTPRPPAPIPIHLQTKIGRSCCGFCCDFRRAVIALNLVFLVFGVLSLVFTAVVPIAPLVINEDDEIVKAFLEDYVALQVVLGVITLLSSFLAVYGAYVFNIYMVGWNAVWIVLSLVGGEILDVRRAQIAAKSNESITASVVSNMVMSMVITLIVVYPHVGFIHQVRKGILTLETYPVRQISRE